MARDNLPDFVIIGAGKSGTSSLAHHIRRHPDAFMASRKELHFFDHHYHRGPDWYRSHFDGSAGYLAVGEATPTYMYEPVAIERMARMLPRAHLVVTLRDPVARAYSHYWERAARKAEPRSFAEAVAAEPPVLPGVDDHPGYLARGRYLEQLERVCAVYPRESLHVILFEDLAARPADVLAELCDFLRLDPTRLPASLERVVNPYVRFRSLWLRERSKRWPKRLRDLVGHVNTTRRPYPPMDRDVRDEVKRRFEHHNDALADWLGRDLSVWDA